MKPLPVFIIIILSFQFALQAQLVNLKWIAVYIESAGSWEFSDALAIVFLSFRGPYQDKD